MEGIALVEVDQRVGENETCRRQCVPSAGLRRCRPVGYFIAGPRVTLLHV